MSGNGFFGNPTNGDLAEISELHDPGNCWHGNFHPDGSPVTSAPADLQITHATCGVPNQGAGLDEPAGGAGDLRKPGPRPVPSAPGMIYPRTTRVVMPPLPRGLQSMPDPCRGVPANAFCARKPRFTG